MRKTIEALLRRQKSCVLATTDGELPHCSLMAYIVDDTCEHLYIATPPDTLKYENIHRNPHVSLLVDTRDEAGVQRVMALTVKGECREVTAPGERAALAKRFAARHGHLAAFLEKSRMAYLRVAVSTFQLLDGPEEAHHVTLR